MQLRPPPAPTDLLVDFPEFFTHTPEKLAAMGPAKRDRGVRHIEKMRKKRADRLVFLDLINAADHHGRCYCRYDGYVCRGHAVEYARVLDTLPVGDKNRYDRALTIARQNISLEEI
jgi:hypothetical protein